MGPRRARAEPGKLSIPPQFKGLMLPREMSCERQAGVPVVPVAPSLQIEIK